MFGPLVLLERGWDSSFQHQVRQRSQHRPTSRTDQEQQGLGRARALRPSPVQTALRRASPWLVLMDCSPRVRTAPGPVAGPDSLHTQRLGPYAPTVWPSVSAYPPSRGLWPPQRPRSGAAPAAQRQALCPRHPLRRIQWEKNAFLVFTAKN